MLITEGFALMVYGMGTVFLFLIILVAATSLMSKVAQKLDTPDVHPDDVLAAAAAAAVHMYRRQHEQ